MFQDLQEKILLIMENLVNPVCIYLPKAVQPPILRSDHNPPIRNRR